MGRIYDVLTGFGQDRWYSDYTFAVEIGNQRDMSSRYWVMVVYGVRIKGTYWTWAGEMDYYLAVGCTDVILSGDVL